MLECSALAGNLGNLAALLQHGSEPAGHAAEARSEHDEKAEARSEPGSQAEARRVSQAVAILDRPLQEGDSQVSHAVPLLHAKYRGLLSLPAAPLAFVYIV
jgi:hypothetical protein